MKIKTSELKGYALDWAVAKCESVALLDPYDNKWERCWTLLADNSGEYYAPSTDWAQGGPIIEREMIQITPHCMVNPLHGWSASFRSFDEDDDVYALHRRRGKTPLLAAMRCYVTSKLGDDVDIPKELT